MLVKKSDLTKGISGVTGGINLDHRADDEFFKELSKNHNVEVWDSSRGVWKEITTWLSTFFISVVSYFVYDLSLLWLIALTIISFISIVPIVIFYTLVNSLVSKRKVWENSYKNNYWRVRLSSEYAYEDFKNKVINPSKGSYGMGTIGLGDDNLDSFVSRIKNKMNTPIMLENGYCTRMYELYTVSPKGDKLILTTNDFKTIPDDSYDLELITAHEMDLEGLYNWYKDLKENAKNINELYLLRKEVDDIKESENRLKEEQIIRDKKLKEKIKYIEDNIEKQKKLREESKEYLGKPNIKKLIEEEKIAIEKDKEELVKRLGV